MSKIDSLLIEIILSRMPIPVIKRNGMTISAVSDIKV